MTASSSTSFNWRILFLCVILCGIGSCCVLAFRNRVGYNVSHAEAPIGGLPDDAANISYFLPGAFGPNMFYEFNTSEKSFLEWARSYDNLKPVEQGPYRIFRYVHDSADNRIHEITINHGYFYEWYKGDQGVSIAYDKETGRAYYWSHTR